VITHRPYAMNIPFLQIDLRRCLSQFYYHLMNEQVHGPMAAATCGAPGQWKIVYWSIPHLRLYLFTYSRFKISWNFLFSNLGGIFSYSGVFCPGACCPGGLRTEALWASCREHFVRFRDTAQARTTKVQHATRQWNIIVICTNFNPVLLLSILIILSKITRRVVQYPE